MQQNDEIISGIDRRLAKLARTPPPVPRDGSIYVRGMKRSVVKLFSKYCKRHGYKKMRAVEYLIEDAVRRDRELKLDDN